MTTAAPTLPPELSVDGDGGVPGRARRRGWRRHAVLIGGSLIVLYPIVWMVSASFRPVHEIFGNSGLWSEAFGVSNYVDGWTGIPRASFARFFLNSFIVSGAAVLGNIVSCSMAAYAFARLRFRGRTLMFAIMLVTIMLPYHVLVIPQYVLFNTVGWVDTFLPLIVPKILATDSFFIFLMVQFIRGIPSDLDEAARIDGCSPFKIYRYVILPLARPALVTTAIFTFIWTWNDFFSQIIYLQNVNNYTVPLGLRLFLDSTGLSSFGAMLAMGVLSLLPLIAIFLFFQRLIVEGIATSGLKG